MTALCSDACTNTREVELQDCPCRFMFMPLIAAAAAFFGSASGKMMIGFLPPSSKLTRFRPAAASCAIARPGRHRADEADALHVGMAHQRRARRAVAGDDVDDAGGKNAFAQLAKPQARQRRLLGALDHDAVAGGERRRGLLGAEAERMIERIDLADDAVRLAAREVEMARTLR